jgi:uncharacterized membrane protein YbhN (UPF0104 family)
MGSDRIGGRSSGAGRRDWSVSGVRRRGQAAGGDTPAVGVVVRATVANLIAWLGYGLAFWLLARAIVPQAALPPGLAIAAFAASYVAGLIALFAPGGLIVREGVLVALLQGTTGIGVAALLAVASRIALTVTEIGAAVPFLLIRVEKPSDR